MFRVKSVFKKMLPPTVLKLLHGDTTVQVGNVLKVLNVLEHRRKNWFKSAEEQTKQAEP